MGNMPQTNDGRPNGLHIVTQPDGSLLMPRGVATLNECQLLAYCVEKLGLSAEKWVCSSCFMLADFWHNAIASEIRSFLALKRAFLVSFDRLAPTTWPFVVSSAQSLPARTHLVPRRAPVVANDPASRFV